MKAKTTKTLKHSYLSSEKQRTLEERRADYFEAGIGTATDKVNSLTRFMSRQNCAKLAAQHEMMKMTSGVLGDILECGVYYGSGLMGWALLATSLEPFNYQCKIVGFDTFEGTKGLTSIDFKGAKFKRREGEYFAPSYKDLQQSIELLDADRPLSHLPKVQLVKGDVCKTAKQHLANNPALSVRILHIGVNIYAPTKASLEAFLPRMSKGGIVAIDGLNYASGGCMQALREVCKERNLALRVFDYYPNFSYFVV